MQELADLVVVVDLEVEAGPRDTVVEREGTVIHQGGLDVLQSVQLRALLLTERLVGGNGRVNGGNDRVGGNGRVVGGNGRVNLGNDRFGGSEKGGGGNGQVGDCVAHLGEVRRGEVCADGGYGYRLMTV